MNIRKTYYGVPNVKCLLNAIDRVCGLFPHTSNRIKLLQVTCMQETKLGTYKDPTPNGAGTGVMQCDRIAFENIKKRFTTEPNKKAYLDIIEEEFGIDLKHLEYNELKYGFIPSIIISVFHYLLIPKPLPNKDDLDGLWEYYKKYYNTTKGKATKEEFMKNIQQLKTVLKEVNYE